MSSSKTGRNDPCPCGSGKKYKQCCLRLNGFIAHEPAEPAGASTKLHEALEERVFGSLEEAQAFVQQFTSQRNQAPRPEFHGLSPDHMQRLLQVPYASPETAHFPDPLSFAPSAPTLALFELLAQHIGEKGLKATATGNLPRKVCRDAALAYWGEEGFRGRTRFGGINTERDFFDLHVTRLTAYLAGLVRKYKGRFILSRDCRALMSAPGAGAVYPRLLRAYTQRYNWGYADGYADLPLIQQSFAFTLYLLSQYGGEERPATFYEEAFLTAFPVLLREVSPNPYLSAEEQVTKCYTLRALVRFAKFFGLAEVRPIDSDEWLARDYQVKKLPLLDRVVQFRVTID